MQRPSGSCCRWRVLRRPGLTTRMSVPRALSCAASSPPSHSRCALSSWAHAGHFPTSDVDAAGKRCAPCSCCISDKAYADPESLAVSQEDAVTEAAALREGEYVAVRRFTRLLEGGAEAKAALDQVLSQLSQVSILRLVPRFLRPKHAVYHTPHWRGNQGVWPRLWPRRCDCLPSSRSLTAYEGT